MKGWIRVKEVKDIIKGIKCMYYKQGYRDAMRESEILEDSRRITLDRAFMLGFQKGQEDIKNKVERFINMNEED